MFVINFLIDSDEETRVLYETYGPYKSEEDAIKDLYKIKKFYESNHFKNVLDIYEFDNSISISILYTDFDFPEDEECSCLIYQITEIQKNDLIPHVTPDNINKTMHDLKK